MFVFVYVFFVGERDGEFVGGIIECKVDVVGESLERCIFWYVVYEFGFVSRIMSSNEVFKVLEVFLGFVCCGYCVCGVWWSLEVIKDCLNWES